MADWIGTKAKSPDIEEFTGSEFEGLRPDDGHRKRAMGLRILKLGATLALMLACSGGQVLTPSPDNLPRADGQRHAVAGSRASLEIPKEFRIVDATTWLLPLGPNAGILAHLQRAQEPADGAMAQLDRAIAELQKQGEADVERDERVILGDLDARLLQALELREKPAKGLWMIVTAAEDGMYTLTVAGPVAEMRTRQAILEPLLLSLRVEAPVGTTRVPPKPVIPPEIDLPLEPTPGTSP